MQDAIGTLSSVCEGGHTGCRGRNALPQTPSGSAAAGQDTDFYKSPEKLIGITDGPFYGCSYKPMLLVVLGGTRTNIDLQALDANDEPIPGLFDVGTMIGDFYSGVYTFAFPRIGAIQKRLQPTCIKVRGRTPGRTTDSKDARPPPGSSGRTGALRSH